MTDNEPTELVARTCAACGVRRPAERVHVVPDRLRSIGHELVYGLCADCADADRLGALDAAVARDLLDLDAGDAVLSAVRVVRFCDLASAHPDRPSPRPWAHVDREALASWVTDWRRDHTERSGGPCAWCGMGLTPPDTKWRMWSRENRPAEVCGRCQHQFGSQIGGSDESRRDAAAVVLAGLIYRNRVSYRQGLGRQLEVIWWCESGRTKPNRVPFGHLDMPALRARMSAIFDAGGMRRPVWWSADRVVDW
jgi:hypothetical protein